MEHKHQAVATRFAENLVGTMLQRSGVEFYAAPDARDTGADFLVRRDGMVLAIEVKYVSDRQAVPELWTRWSGTGSGQDRTGLRHRVAGRHDTDTHHLVIVTGAGEHVFTDGETAAVLATDHRTALTIMGAPWQGSRPG